MFETGEFERPKFDCIEFSHVYPNQVNLRGVITRLHLLKSSAACKCLMTMNNLGIQTNSLDPDQTAPRGAG